MDISNFVTPGQQSKRELETIAIEIARLAPCNVLVYGVGNDSLLYLTANRGGKTVFVEHDEDWIHRMHQNVQQNTLHVQYFTTVESSLNSYESSVESTGVTKYKWDVIVIDGPTGYNSACPGRHVPICEAALVASKQEHISIFVHDCDRQLEILLCDAHLKNISYKQYDRTRLYYN